MAIGGLMPIALFTNPLISPLAIALIGGLISSTLLSRVVKPWWGEFIYFVDITSNIDLPPNNHSQCCRYKAIKFMLKFYTNLS
jgi:hypothetical protein